MRDDDDEEEEEESKEASSPKKGLPRKSHLTTEEDEEEDWNTQRDEEAEARRLAAQLSGGKGTSNSASTKRRRITKLSEAEDRAKSRGLSYRGLADDDLDDEDDMGAFIEDDTGGNLMLDKDDDYGARADKRLLDRLGVQDAFMPGATPLSSASAGKPARWATASALSRALASKVSPVSSTSSPPRPTSSRVTSSRLGSSRSTESSLSLPRFWVAKTIFTRDS